MGYQLKSEEVNKFKEIAESKDMDFYELIYESGEFNDYEFLTESDYENVIGEYIAYTSDYEVDPSCVSLESLNEKADKLVKFLKEKDIEITREEVKVYTGTQMC